MHLNPRLSQVTAAIIIAKEDSSHWIRFIISIYTYTHYTTGAKAPTCGPACGQTPSWHVRSFQLAVCQTSARENTSFSEYSLVSKNRKSLLAHAFDKIFTPLALLTKTRWVESPPCVPWVYITKFALPLQVALVGTSARTYISHDPQTWLSNWSLVRAPVRFIFGFCYFFAVFWDFFR